MQQEITLSNIYWSSEMEVHSEGRRNLQARVRLPQAGSGQADPRHWVGEGQVAPSRKQAGRRQAVGRQEASSGQAGQTAVRSGTTVPTGSGQAGGRKQTGIGQAAESGSGECSGQGWQAALK